jgi:hypothetical protein
VVLTVRKIVPTFVAMYFKVSIRTNPATGAPGGYYRLVESYRNVDGRVCHRTLLNVGFMDGVQPEELNRIQKLLNHKSMNPDNELFTVEYDRESLNVRRWFEVLYTRLFTEKRIDVPHLDTSFHQRSSSGDWHSIDMNSLRHRDVREIGGEWLCYQALEQLGLGSFLSKQVDWSTDDVRLALTHIISRAVYPASELKTNRWIQENSAVCELTRFPVEKITKDLLYGISHRLYALKDILENYLSHKTNDLFDIQDKIIIYDLTNTYFVLGLVINQFGFIKYSSILQGNVSDSSTLEGMIKDLRRKTSTTAKKALVVIDAGIAIKDNLAKIRAAGYDYLCVSRSKMKDYEIVTDSQPLTVVDNRRRKIQLQKVIPAQASEAENEKRGTKIEAKVHERVGRLKQKYPSIHKYYEIDYQVNETPAEKRKKKPPQRVVTSMTWKLKDNIDMNERCGVYFLGTSLNDENRILWDSYNTIREVESTIKVLKSDLDMRPIFHKKDDSAMAHLHLAILAYWVVNTIRYQLKEKGITHCWSEIVRIMNTQKAVTTTAQNNCEQIIKIRRCSEPNEKVKTIYQALKYKSEPFKKKKSCSTQIGT